MFGKIVLMASAGAAGTLARYWVSGWMYKLLGQSFAWGTLAVNVLGSLVFGIIWTLAEERYAISPMARLIALTGFMGAFTTFSTFAFETMNYVRDSQFLLAFANISANCILGFGAIVLGAWIARVI